MRIAFYIVLAFIGFQVLHTLQDRYLPDGFFSKVVDKTVELSADTYDALSGVVDKHVTGEDE